MDDDVDGHLQGRLPLPIAQQQDPSRAAQPLTIIGVAERLVAGAALAGTAIYVLINGLYIEFYDDLGVRPEDVGLDRLAILGRAAWVALVAIALVGLIGYFYAALSAENRLRAERLQRQVDRAQASEPLPEERSQEAEDPAAQEQSQPEGTKTRRQERQRLRRLVVTPIALAIASLIVPVLAIFAFVRFEQEIENEVDHVRQDET